MSYRCSIYNLGVVANRTIPGVPSSSIDSIDLRISFGEPPAWVRELDHRDRQLSYTSEYTDSAGTVFHGDIFRFLAGDPTGVLPAYAIGLALVAAFALWALYGLRRAERAG